jgi:hypothetical protein
VAWLQFIGVMAAVYGPKMFFIMAAREARRREARERAQQNGPEPITVENTPGVYKYQ